MTKRLAVIDGKSVFYRGYYAMPGLSLPDGTPTGGVYGFASLAIELIKKLEPDYVAVAWDKKGTNIRKRQQMYPEYKANRKKAPDDFYAQIPILMELLDAFGWPMYELDDYEADDILGAFARQASEKGIETCLITSDLDALQLIKPLVKVYAMKNGLSNIEEFDVEYFENKYGINVHQFLDLKSLKGDSSDNLPGVPGIGEKTGITLLQQYKTLDNIYEHLDEIKPTVAEKLRKGKDLAYISREVGRIWDDAPVELDWQVADINDIDLNKVASILDRLEFNSLINRLPKHMNINLAVQKNDDVKDLKIEDYRDSLEILESVMLAVVGDELFLSFDDSIAYKVSQNSYKGLVKELNNRKIIGFDVKTICHFLDKFDCEMDFADVYDILQAAFLINPLMRDHSLYGVLHLEESAGVSEVIANLWHTYKKQKQDFEAIPSLASIARDFDFPLVNILYRMEKEGIKIDKSILIEMKERIDSELKGIESQIIEMAGYEFNIASPIQLSEVLFTKLQLPTTGIKKGKTGYSTGQKELDKLRGQHPIIELIEKSRELAKLKNTYVDVLPELADENDRIHTTFKQDVASTGRLSSTNPNLQNIPIRTELGRDIRRAFVPADGQVFVSADYSQFELRLAAFLAGDKEMIDDFNSDIDIHTKTASEVYKVPFEQVTKDQRRNAKVINFGVLYGMSPHGLSAATGMSFGEAKKFIDEYFTVRQPIRAYIDNTIKNAKELGYVETFFGRRRPTPDLKSSNFMVRMSAERAAANMPIQGTEADLMKLAMIRVEEKIKGLGKQILQIHDSILIETPKENADEIARILKTEMENVSPEIGVKLRVDVNIGDNWGNL